MALGRTNIYNSSGDGVTTVDLPTRPSSISATSGNKQVTINLAYSSTTNISGVMVRYKIGSYPTSPSDGSGKTFSGAPTSINVTGLTNDTKYYFRIYLYRTVNGVNYYQTDTTNSKVSGSPSGGVVISGIGFVEYGPKFAVINDSGNFTMTIPDGFSVTAYMVGGGCQGQWGHNGGKGGYGGGTLSKSISAGTYSCSAVIGAAVGCTLTGTGYKTPSTTTLKVGAASYTTSSTGNSSNSGWGSAGRDGLHVPCNNKYIGSSGGHGGDNGGGQGGSGGKGAGSGGDGGSPDNYDGQDGESAYWYGCGGGGGGYHDIDYDNTEGSCGYGGLGMGGCIILSW